MNAITDITQAAPFTIGQPLYASAIGLHWVAAIEPDVSGARLLVGGPSPLAPVRFRIVAVSSDGRRFTMDEHTAAARAEKGASYPSRDDTAELLRRADAAHEEGLAKARADHAAREQARDASADLVAKYRPAWAAGAIIAELHEDKSDGMTDYFSHSVVRTVVLAWTRHARDLFPELRKAAALLPETAHLATDPEERDEHREKYSMGAGYYLKRGFRDDSGWCVKKQIHGSLNVPGLEFTAEAKGERTPPAARVAPVAAQGLFSIEEHTHTKKGFQMWIATMGERVERARYDELLSAARELGGWYSKPWNGTPGGFAFKQEDAARQFVANHGGTDDAAPAAPRAPKVAKAPAAGLPDKLRAIADGMQPKIEHCLRDRDTNTPRKARMAAEARNDGSQWERAQAIARRLAYLHESGDVPAELAGVKSKAELFALAAEEMDRGGGYYDAGRPLGRPYTFPHDPARTARIAAAWAILTPADPSKAAAEELRRKLDDLRFAKIPGYFPTPADLVAEMIERADLAPGSDVIEPSAGSGAIADALRDAGHNVRCFEHWPNLAEVLRLKGHDVEQRDWLDVIPDKLAAAVIMNPPFERGQDVEHVLHAFNFVRPGGALVAIMGAGITFRAQRPYSTFRDWLDEHGAEIIEIPAGAFKESGTGVASVMVIVRKGAE